MNVELLHEVGETLYGEHWRPPLSRALEVDDRTMRRWAAGTLAIPQSIAGELLTLVFTRQQALSGLITNLVGAAKA